MSAAPLKSVNEVLRAVEQLPSLPQAITEIIRTLDDDAATAKMLANKIEGDAGLLASVLKMVNSSRFAVQGGITSTQQAVQLLGFNCIRNLVCMKGLADYFKKNSNDGFDFGKFMRHSIGVACCAKHIARQSWQNPDIAFVSGILHDIGQLAMAATLPHAYGLVEEYRKQHNCHIAVAELAVLKADHAQAGSYMAQRWNFPAEISMSIEFHHNVLDAGEGVLMADVIHLAEVLSHALDLGMTSRVPHLCDESLFRLQLSFSQMVPLFDVIEDEYEEFANLLGVSNKPAADVH